MWHKQAHVILHDYKLANIHVCKVKTENKFTLCRISVKHWRSSVKAVVRHDVTQLDHSHYNQ